MDMVGDKSGKHSVDTMNIDVEYCWCDDTRKEGKTKQDE